MATSNTKTKPKFDWERFANKGIDQVIHCETEKEVNMLREMLHERGFRWCNGDLYTSIDNGKFRTYKERTCYSNRGMYGSIAYYDECGYEIYKFSSYDFT